MEPEAGAEALDGGKRRITYGYKIGVGMSRKVQLTLMTSMKMSDKEENGVIRLPRKARDHFGFTNSVVVVGKGEHRFGLEVKKAYKADIQKLAKKLGSGRVSEEEALSAGFVTRSILQKINRRQGESVWISDSLEEITVGADPEFGLRDSYDRFVRGNNVIKKAGAFGSDGPAVEVRPAPSVDHLTMVGNISKILQNPPEVMNPYKWVGGATFSDENRNYWFGGHIHLGRPAQIDPDNAIRYCYNGIATVLDHLLAFPLVRFDTPNPNLRRHGCDYGYGTAGTGDTGDTNSSVRSHIDRFEYRVLSALWVAHPTLAKVVVGAAKAITESVYTGIASKRFEYDWVGSSPFLKNFGISSTKSITDIINRSKADGITKDHLNRWRKQIRDLERFDDYSEELNALIALVGADPSVVKRHLDLDLRQGWCEEERFLRGMDNTRVKDALEAVEAKK